MPQNTSLIAFHAEGGSHITFQFSRTHHAAHRQKKKTRDESLRRGSYVALGYISTMQASNPGNVVACFLVFPWTFCGPGLGAKAWRRAATAAVTATSPMMENGRALSMTRAQRIVHGTWTEQTAMRLCASCLLSFLSLFVPSPL